MYSLSAIALVAEEKILEAQHEGAFDNLPGSGKPLPLDDEAWLPPEMRMAYKILKNSGYLAGNNRLELKEENREESAKHGRLLRFAVMYGRVRRARQKAAGRAGPSGKAARPGADAPEDARGLDAALAAALTETLTETLENSPYFDKILKRM
jgi:hypothetical protein